MNIMRTMQKSGCFVVETGRGAAGCGRIVNTHLNLGESFRHSSKSIVARIVVHAPERHTHTHTKRRKHLIWLNFAQNVFALLAFYTNIERQKNIYWAAFSCCFCSKIDWLDDWRERED